VGYDNGFLEASLANNSDCAIAYNTLRVTKWDKILGISIFILCLSADPTFEKESAKHFKVINMWVCPK
jgi:hypothetical protein